MPSRGIAHPGVCSYLVGAPEQSLITARDPEEIFLKKIFI
jgi:hypothetical protein